MRGNELLDKLELIDNEYIEAAEAAEKAPRVRSAWLKWGTAAACLALLIAGLRLTPGLLQEPEGKPELYPEQSAPLPEDVGNTEPAVDIAIISADELQKPYNGINVAEAGTFNNQSFLSGKPMISGYEGGANETDSSGDRLRVGVHYSQALCAAMDQYGTSANYRVLVEIFSDGAQIPAGSGQALAVAERLAEQGYIVALETVTVTEQSGGIASVHRDYYFTLHVDYDQLKNFPVDEGLSYSLMLYEEHFGGAADGGAAQSYNGAAREND